MVLILIASMAHADPPPAMFVAPGRTTVVEGPVHVIPKERMDVIIARLKDAEDYEEKVRELLDLKGDFEVSRNALVDALESNDELAQSLLERESSLQEFTVKLRRRTGERNIAIAVAATAAVAMGVGYGLSR